jgi:hypothetical protein
VEILQTDPEARCTECRGGLVCADEWAAWYGRADEVEAAYRAEQGCLKGLEASEEWQILLDERPTCDKEIDCVECGGTGIIPTDPGRAALASARLRLQHSAA